MSNSFTPAVAACMGVSYVRDCASAFTITLKIVAPKRYIIGMQM
jgi:hypothetical protein